VRLKEQSLPQPLAIVHVARSPVGGVFRHIADLSAAQRAAGHSVGLICDSVTAGPFEEERIGALGEKLDLGVVRLFMRRSIGPADLPAISSVAGHVHRMKADVIHCHGAKGGVYGRLAAFLERRRGRAVACFYAPHGGSLHYESGSMAGRVYFTVERALERMTHGLIHVSAYEAETYRKKIGMPGCPANVVVNGLRPEEFEPVELAPDAADFLFIGTLRDLKGVDVYLNALALLAKRGTAFRALIVGAGEPADEQRYSRMAQANGLVDRIVFLPPMPARRAFALARAVIVPSRAESMPYLILEAAAAGRPLIATNVGGIPEILAGERETLIPPGDPAALADAMAQALVSPGRLDAEAMLRRDRLRQRFSLSVMAGRIEDIYRGALERYREREAGLAPKAGYSR
jgi:glycosyltransferase involved in cell wall biosynthesis